MNTVTSTFQWEREGESLILTPQADLHELDYQEIEAEEQEILAFLDSTPVRNVVVDFRKTDFFGSSALGFFLKLWRKVRESGGHMAFCNVSDHEQELFRLTRLDRLWPVWPTCEEAMAAVRR
jgi:anti-sigma B factor antagonist